MVALLEDATHFQENVVCQIISQDMALDIYIDFNAHDNNVGLLLIFSVVGHQFMKLIWIFKYIN